MLIHKTKKLTSLVIFILFISLVPNKFTNVYAMGDVQIISENMPNGTVTANTTTTSILIPVQVCLWATTTMTTRFVRER